MVAAVSAKPLRMLSGHYGLYVALAAREESYKPVPVRALTLTLTLAVARALTRALTLALTRTRTLTLTLTLSTLSLQGVAALHCVDHGPPA